MIKSATLILALVLSMLASGQVFTPTFLQQSLQPSAISGAGKVLAFASSLGNSQNQGAEVYVVNSDGTGLRRLTTLQAVAGAGATAASLTADGRWVAFTAAGSGTTAGSPEEVHLVDVATAGDRTLAVDKQSCVLPAAICLGCIATCLRTPHVFDDGSAVLYSALRTNPFYLVRSDGFPALNLPIYTGSLAASSKRVISRGGQVVFTSNAPSGPTFAAAPTQVYLINPDGSNLRAVTQFTDTSSAPQDATISADGSTIAFTLPSTSGTALYTVRSDGSQLSVRASGNISSPSLSADGKVLAYITSGAVQVIGISTTPAIVKPVSSLQFSQATDATISDDGSRVAFAIGPLSGGTGAIYTVGSDGSAQTAAYAPRSLSVNGVYGAVAGSLATIYGTNFTLDMLVTAATLPLPKTLAGVSLLVGKTAAPLDAVSPWQINAQIPPDTPAGSTTFTATFVDGPSTNTISGDVATILPSIYGLPAISFSQAAVFHGNTAVAADPGHPATAGEILVMYASGLGDTTPPVAAGAAPPANPPATTNATPQVAVDNKSAQVLFSGLAPGLVGVYQVNFVMPPGVLPGPRLVTVAAGGITSNALSINVK